MPVVLKVVCVDEVRRVKLDQVLLQKLTYDEVCQAVAQIWPDLPTYRAKYKDCESELCALTTDTVKDFVSSAKVVSDETILRLELHAKDQKAVAPAKEEPTSAEDIPSLFCSWFHLFTMGFIVKREKILRELGPKELATKIKAEASAMSLVIALCWKCQIGLYLQASKGGWDAFFTDGADKSLGWYLWAGLVTIAMASLSTALLCNILLLISMSNLVEAKVEAFVRHAGWAMRVPYLGTVYGLILYLASMGLVSYFVDGRRWLYFVIGCMGCGVSVVSIAGARYIHATYIANNSDTHSVGGASSRTPQKGYQLLASAD